MDRGVRNTYLSLLLLNFSIVAFISFTIYSTTNEICSEWQARSFLEFARYLPHVSWKVPTYSLTLFFIAAGILLKLILGSKSRPGTQIFLYTLVLVIFGGITYYLNFSYKGFFLMAAAGAFLFMPNLISRMISIAATLLFFILFDYDLLTVRLNMVSFRDYILHYDPHTQFTVYVVRSLLESANLIILVIFFYSLVQSKVQENRAFIALNNELSDRLFDLEVARGKLEEAAKMKERNRLAHDIHDIIGHSLTSVSTGLEACIQVSGEENQVLKKHLEKIKEITDKGLRDIRRSVKELKIDAIEKYTLHNAVRELLDDIGAMGKIKARLAISGSTSALQSDEEQTVYRLVQESITNTLKYGKARHIEVEFSYGRNNLNIRISDDGVGCSRIKKNFGLNHIEEQLALLGGNVEFITGTNRGFKTIAELPLRKSVHVD